MIDASTRASLDQHIVAALAILYRTIAGGSFEITPHWARGFSGLPWPNFNILLPLSPRGLTDDTLADAAAYFADVKVHYSIELVHDRLPDGPDFLDQRNYQSLPPQPAMVSQDLCIDFPSNSDVDIEPVRTVPSLTAFYTLIHEIFDFPITHMAQLFPVRHLKNEVIQHYLAFVDEQPVGAGTIICVEDVASIWNLCTLDSYRRQGVATAMLHHMLEYATENYCQVAMLYSTAQAFPLFNKCGFEIYTQRQWFLPPGIDYDDEWDET